VDSIRTETDVRRAAPPVETDRARYKVDGAAGLWLRVTRNGAKTWRLESRKLSPARFRTLGSWPAVSLADAKAAALQILGDAERARVNRKHGPVMGRKDRRTLGDVLDNYGAARSARIASWPAQRRAIEHHYNDMLTSPVERVTAEAILEPVERLRTVGVKRAAGYLSAVLRHAKIDETVGGRELDDLVPETARTRVLDDHELRAVLTAADGLEPLWRDFTRALVLLMARRGDVARVRPEHLDLGARIWSARIHKTKGHGHRVERMPLSRAAVDLLAGRAEPGATYIFEPSPGAPLRHNFDRVLKRLHRLSGVSGWSWHDLRRTGRTLMARRGVRPDIAERCMSHSTVGSMIAVYDRYDYEADMRAAFEALAGAVEDIETGRAVTRA
jgi:integrase